MQVQRNIESSVSRAWKGSRIAPQPAKAIFLGLGSVVTSKDRETIRNMVQEIHLVPEGAIGVDHDLRVALMGGLTGDAGIALIAGTGSSCYGRDASGQQLAGGRLGAVSETTPAAVSGWVAVQ